MIKRDVWHSTDDMAPPEDEELLIWIDNALHFGHARVSMRPGTAKPSRITWFCQEGESGYYGDPQSTDYDGRGSFWMLPSPPESARR